MTIPKAGGDSAPVIIPERFNADNTLPSQAKGKPSTVDAERSQQTPAMPGDPDRGSPPSAQTQRIESTGLVPQEHSRKSSPASGRGVSPATAGGDSARIVFARPEWLESDPESLEDSDDESEEFDADQEYRNMVFDADQIKPLWHFATREGSKQLTPQPAEEVKAAYAPASKKKVSEVAARTYDPVRRYDADRDDKVAIAESKTVWGALMLQLCVILYKMLGQADMSTIILE